MNRYVTIVVATISLPVITAAALFAACGSSGASSAGPVPSVAAATSQTVATPPVTTRPRPVLKDGRYFGFIKSVGVSSSSETIAFDLASLLSGEQANQAAAERGYPTPVDNDYFIVNDNPKVRTLALSSDVEILLVNWKRCCDDFVSATPERFRASFGRPPYSVPHPQGEYSEYWVTVEDGDVAKVEEQYTP